MSKSTRHKRRREEKLKKNKRQSFFIKHKEVVFYIFSIVSIIALGLIVYSNTYHAAFQYDDNSSIINNLQIRDLSNYSNLSMWTRLQNGRQLAYLTYALNFHWGGLDTYGYHIFNIIIHILCGISVFWLIVLTFKTQVMRNLDISKNAKYMALLGALLFVGHPIQTQGVTYLVQRMASMATLFYIFSICLYIKGRLRQIEYNKLVIPLIYYFAAFICFVLGMWAKDIVYTLPVAIIMFEIFFIRSKENKLYTKYIITAVALVIIAVLFELISGIMTAETIKFTRAEYLMTQFRVLVTYIRLLFVPYNQNVDYEFATSHSLFDLPTLGSLLILIGIVIGGVFLFKKYRLLSFGIFWFFLTQSIESSIFPITDVIFEHRLYLSMFGFVLFFVSLFYYFLIQKKSKRFVVLSLLLIIAAYSYAAYARNKVWESNFSLFSDVIAKSPHKARPYYGRAKIYNDLKQYPEAIADCNKSLENDPRCAEAYNNRGMALALLNRDNFPKAFADFDSALSIQPLYPDAMQNLANMFFMVGNYDSAIVKFYGFIKAYPNAVGGYNGLGASYMNKNMLDSAIVNLDKGIKITTENAQLYFNRGLAYLKKNQFNNAMLDFNSSLNIDPNNGEVYYNRALAYRGLAMPTQAWQDVQTAIEKGYKIPQWVVDQLKRELSNPALSKQNTDMGKKGLF